jgi:hypothetical protein
MDFGGPDSWRLFAWGESLLAEQNSHTLALPPSAACHTEFQLLPVFLDHSHILLPAHHCVVGKKN